MIRVAIVGSREIRDYDFVEKKFLELVSEKKLNLDEVIIVSGGAEGVDSLAQRIAKKYGLTIIIHYPRWSVWGRAAGPVRNRKIVADADVVLAIKGSKSRGTIDTIRKAREAGKEVLEIDYQ